MEHRVGRREGPELDAGHETCELVAGLVAIERQPFGRERLVADDQVRGLLGHHHHRRIDVAVRDVREHGGVHDAEPARAADLHRRGIGHGQLVGAHPGRARGMERRLGVAGDPFQDLGVGRDARSRGDLAVVERFECGLAEDVPRDVDRLDPFAPVLVGRQVVEAERGVLRRIGALDRGSSRARPSTSARRAPGSRGPSRATTRRSGSRSAGSGTSGSGTRRRRCCGRSRRLRSGSWRPARAGGRATGSRPTAGSATAWRAPRRRAAGCDAGCTPRGGPAGARRRPGRRRRRRCRAAPAPRHCRRRTAGGAAAMRSPRPRGSPRRPGPGRAGRRSCIRRRPRGSPGTGSG